MHPLITDINELAERLERAERLARDQQRDPAAITLDLVSARTLVDLMLRLAGEVEHLMKGAV